MGIITPESDPLGQALLEWQHKGRAKDIVVRCDLAENDSLDPAWFFRTLEEMPRTEQAALKAARGRVLDLGAGGGCHGLELQNRGLEVTCCDASELCCQVMVARGLNQVRCRDLWDLEGQWDTVLLAMNGLGLAGTMDRLEAFVHHCLGLVAPGGQLVFDSTDLGVLHQLEEGEELPAEFVYTMEYRRWRGEPFGWIYPGQALVRSLCPALGCRMEVLYNDPDTGAWTGCLAPGKPKGS